jgi:hypothetical protein
MNTYGGSDGIAPPFLTPTPDGGEWSASRPSRFTPEERAAGTHWIRDWVGFLKNKIKIKKEIIRNINTKNTIINKHSSMRNTLGQVLKLCCPMDHLLCGFSLADRPNIKRNILRIFN